MLTTGLKAWVVQRLSAVYLTVFSIWLAAHFWFHAPDNYLEWMQWLGKPYIGTAVGLFFVALILHAWVGVRDVIMDYIHPMLLRSTVLSAVILFLAGMIVWALKIILNIEYQ